MVIFLLVKGFIEFLHIYPYVDFLEIIYMVWKQFYEILYTFVLYHLCQSFGLDVTLEIVTPPDP